MANGCRCESAREEWRGGAGRQRKKESLFKDGEIPAWPGAGIPRLTTAEGGGFKYAGQTQAGTLEAWPRLHQGMESSSMSLTDSAWLAVDPHRSPYRSL